MERMQYQTKPSEYADAFKSARCAKNIFWLLLGLAILAQMASFILVEFVDVLDLQAKQAPATPPARRARATTHPATMAASTMPASAPAAAPGTMAASKVSYAGLWHDTLAWVLPATKILALVLAILLALAMLFCVKISLLGHLGGVSGFVSGFFWSLILVALVTPWQQVLNSAYVTGALFNLTEMLNQVNQAKPAVSDKTSYYACFLGYPFVALLVWLIVQLKFAAGYGRMNLSTVVGPSGMLPPEPKL